MYLAEVKLFAVVKNQFLYKLKAHLSIFSSLLIIQVVGMLLSMNGSGSMGTSSDGYSLNISYYTGDIIIIFTMIWSFISAIIITTKAYRNDDFVFVANRFSSNLSNICFLVFASIIGGVTAMLSGILLKVVMYFILDDGNVMGTIISFQELLLGMIVSTFYVLLVASLGYLVGVLVQISKWFSVLLPAVFFGYLFLSINKNEEAPIILETVKFFVKETSLLFFVLKVIVTASILFYGSIILANKMEVRQ
ncbi:hypothetical protein [Metabacillus rhizolycopersici]|uniref:ABC transporter permease n=1 Tax=Metabacillus rhizolycopersici TaxID=2875709 RepID=A0ABS7UR46_9BACI|nr:hypothetical protein [Metabacillus rhizolycopersici]MBZ5750788.1 hypothetical protein [Metabacillus rhizolycopersici]